MARALGEMSTLVLEGTESAPATCTCYYHVADGDLQEPPTSHDEATPDFNQQADTMCAAVTTTVKTAESI